MAQEDQVTVKLPNALTRGELIGEGKTPEAADNILNTRVFGVGHKTDDKGKPIEQGMGSPGNETYQHKEALRVALERKAMANPNSADVIAAAVAAGVQAGLAARDAEKF